MKKSILSFFFAGLMGLAIAEAPKVEEGFTSIFDGTLKGWKMATENANAFKIENGAIVAYGDRCHLFYEVGDQPLKDFVLRLQVMTKANSNGGIFFHTEYQEKGWPQKGHEAQINNTFEKDPRKTASVYKAKDIMNQSPTVDDKWFDYEIKVQGKKITISIDGKVVNEYEEPAQAESGSDPGRRLSQGTIALQAHDPGSTVMYKNIRVKRL
jgi:hypothetical protein